MQEQVVFKLAEGFLSLTSADAALLGKELQENVKAVEALLTSYHFRSRGRVYNVTVDESSVELLNPQMGKFVASYTLGQFNACADVDYSERAAMEILVDIDKEKGLAILTGEYIPEREPDEF